MSSYTPIDSFGRPAILGSCDGKTVPVRVSRDGGLAPAGYRLAGTVRLDLSVSREKERIEIAISSLSVTSLSGSFFMYLGGDDENLRCTVDKCMSVNVTTDVVYISNPKQEGGYAEIWFFVV